MGNFASTRPTGNSDVTRKHCLSLLQIGDALDTLAGAKWLSTLDLNSGFWQVDLHSDPAEP
jgi:hypothetical protein